ncbi:tetratricopeptide repeat protein, partial [Acidobacteriota bacterium]
YKLIIAPQLELYDVEADPGELNNLTSSQPQETRQLMDLATRFIEESSRNALEMDYRHMDEETRQKLTALGYIGTFTDASSLQGRRLGDPKEKIVVFNQLSQAKEWALQGKFDEGIALIDRIITDDPDVIDAYFTKGNLYFKSRRFEEALQSFFQVLDKKPDDVFTGINIANSYIAQAKFDEAEAFLSEFVKIIPPDSQISFIQGNINFAQKDYEEAERNYRECMKLNPSSASAYNALGGIFVITERLDEAEEYLNLARERNDKLSNLRYNFAQLFEARGDMAAAESEYLAELVNVPHSFRTSFNISRLYRLQGRVAEEMKYLEQTIESNPRFPLSYFYKARLFLNQGIDLEEAVELVHKGIELKPPGDDLRLGYYILADLYNRLGDPVKSAEYAQRGHALRDKTNKN